MKPNELIRKRKSCYDRRGHADVERRLQYYMEDDCVIAYLKEKLGTIFIIKSKRKYFAFIYQNPDLYFGGYGYNNVVDKKLFGDLNKFIILEALK